MEFTTGFGRTRLPILAAAFVFASVLAAPAQTVPVDEPEDAEAAPAPEVGAPEILKGIDVDKLDWSQLSADASAADGAPGAKKRAAGNPTAIDGPN